jgi:hypothetical protein
MCGNFEKSKSRSSIQYHYRGGPLQRGICSTRITVTLVIFNFRTIFFAQIVENRETRLSSPFLGSGDNLFGKVMTKTRSGPDLYGSCDKEGHQAIPGGPLVLPLRLTAGWHSQISCTKQSGVVRTDHPPHSPCRCRPRDAPPGGRYAPLLPGFLVCGGTRVREHHIAAAVDTRGGEHNAPAARRKSAVVREQERHGGGGGGTRAMPHGRERA